ncbi:ferrous iron transport protein B [Sulfurospirillum sp. T05]|uniref:Ferrous iron transport protein B n=1 Tax=Sulfurospirillum tamanense TaxID=2813362 RepID=A0ABS2WR50_9BACT|nr:ferrous iron transport protein B [Sulfurospirillum tamanensis]MBN2963863.1 ferrous iron transport protein B [Sulfurospirillum tamanensis]
MSTLTIALVGQPNVGKSMLINSISNANLRVGNFSGVTVEKAEVVLTRGEDEIRIIDLPGSYALGDYTLEERVTKRFLEEESYDLILNVVDSTNLERNLLLTTELMELNHKMVVALNMSDEAKKEGISIDHEQLSGILGIPCMPVSAFTKEGIEALIETCLTAIKTLHQSPKMSYSEPVEEEIARLVALFKEKGFTHAKLSARDMAVKLLQENKTLYQEVRNEPVWIEVLPVLQEALEHLYVHYDTKNLVEIFSEERYAYAKGAVTEVCERAPKKQKTTTEKIDEVLIHKLFGIPIFLFFMWGLFQLTFTLGAVPMDMIDALFGYFGDQARVIFGDGELGSLVADGAIAGVGAVVMFLPNIMILFLGIALLETTGYMARVAFLLDGFFHRFGLHGKSFIPLVTGFGCSVPAYMAARTLKNDKDRLITLFIIGFMSCGAKLPVYVLFAGAFFGPEKAGNVLFAIYIAGALLGLVAAKVLKAFVFKGKDEPFVMEMPKYRLPSAKLVWHTVMGKSLVYLKKAGTFILVASVLVWFASSYPKNEDLESAYELKIEQALSEEEQATLANELQSTLLSQSYLGRIGQATEFLFAPLGFDWRLTVALETGLAAKEVIISTMGVLYALGEEVDEESEGLMGVLQASIPFPVALSFITFVMFYLPCLAATVVFTKESGSYRYLGYLILFTTAVAWSASFIVYRVALLLS